MKSPAIDHLLYAACSLEKGMDEIESLLGVRPVPAGHHPRYGTHNALLSFGDGVYFEVIARDPSLPEPEAGPFVNLPSGAPSRLITWVARTTEIEVATRAANLAGASLGEIWAGSRRTPDGGEVSWKATDPYAMPFDGAIPFLIDWGETTHPSEVMPVAGKLNQLSIEHPESERIRQIVDVLGVTVKVNSAERYHLVASIQTENGEVILR